MAAHALRAMQCIRHIPDINHESLVDFSAATQERSDGLYRRHCHFYGDHRGPPGENERSVRMLPRNYFQDSSQEMRFYAQ